MLDAQQIQDIIPHRYPFLLVDRILEVEGEKRAVGIKNVTVNEEFFNGHFPGYPVMPGVLIVEALAQVFGVIMLGKEENKGKIGLFAGIDSCRFKRQVKPGDQVFYSKYAGTEVKLEGVEYIIVKQSDILAIVE